MDPREDEESNKEKNSFDLPQSGHHPIEVTNNVASSETKNKLNKLMSDFSVFDENMKVGTRQRREKDENRLAEMKHEMLRLENLLNSEIKKRIEMNKSLEYLCIGKTESMMTKFENLLNNCMEKVDKRLVDLSNRLEDFEKQFEMEKKKIPNDIESRTMELTKQMNHFMEAFEEEKKRRSERETSILKRLADHENQMHEYLEVQRKEREKNYRKLNGMLEIFIQTRNKGDERFSTFVEEEIARLQNDIVLESAKREREDDEIVNALNRYTTKLQDSLKIINSTTTT